MHAFTSALSPLQASIALAAFDIVEGEEGSARRRALDANARHLREALARHGFSVMGKAGPMVAVRLGAPNHARRMTAEMTGLGTLVGMAEVPAVPRNSARWLVQLMSSHREEQLDAFVELAIRARSRIG